MTECKVLVVGAGSAGRMAVSEMLRVPGAGFVPVAFIDDDPAKQGTKIEGIPVVGGREAIPEALVKTGADEIIIALPSVHGGVVRDIVATCRSMRVRFRIVPGIWEIIRGDVHIEQIRSVEPEDLLGRETVEAETSFLAPAYRGKRVLVTGGGGSIGSELVRQILELDPEHLVMVGRGENSLFETGMTLPPSASWEASLVDLKNREAVERLFARVRPQVVLHAAAHKHVSFMEQAPEEAVLNNIVATRDLIAVCESSGTERFVMVSTDKAVNPRSVMGASKRIAELLLGERNGRGSLRLMTVRFGNVLGSRGSVVPLFQHQIRRGGPVTISHRDAARFFMTRKEAVMLVLEAGAMGEGGEIFILDMGEQILIMDLARELITLSGLRPDADIAIEIKGLGPGEKLREELVHSFENLEATRNPRIQAARRKDGQNPPIEDVVVRLEELARNADRDGIREELAAALPEAVLNPEPS